MKLKNALIGLSPAVLFPLLCILGLFAGPGDRVYDLFLRFRESRSPSQEVTFLDADDDAIAYNGVFPWPRSVMADGLLRLKEYGARAAVFDIEYTDKGPPGVDAVYLRLGMPADFNRSFTEINTRTQELLDAIQSNRINRNEINRNAQILSRIISDERDSLLSRAGNIARDNDQYLIHASRLFGRSWASLNLRHSPLSGDLAERRSIAEKRFSYPVEALPNANKGKYSDILPPLPEIALSAAGAGFTNAEAGRDGIRRRVDLAQNIHDHWYLQFAFSPLVDYLGNPFIELGASRMILKDAKMPDGASKNIKIPLDGKGRMLLDWQKADYPGSFSRISFADFSLLEDLEIELESCTQTLPNTDIAFFSEYDPSLERIPLIITDIVNFFDKIHTARADALEDCSDESFKSYTDCRRINRGLLREILNLEPEDKVKALVPELAELYPDRSAAIREKAEYISDRIGYIRTSLDRYESVRGKIENAVNGKFCILGRADTGTHGVVLDMILSGSFITPVGVYWQALIAFVFVTLFFLASASSNLLPVTRVSSGFILIVIISALAALLFRFTGLFFNPLATLASLLSTVILREIVSYADSERKKQSIKNAFSPYVSVSTVKEIIAAPSHAQLGGTKRRMTALFTDIKGFSAISERLDPEKLVTLLNLYFSAMGDMVLEEKGTIDKFDGDAITAFFGAPVELPDHALRACYSAIAMKKIEKELNKRIVGGGLSPAPLLTRIGINTGNMVAGNTGTENKMNYTIIGNSVNLAARLEGFNKRYGTWILASGDTVEEAQGKILARKLDRVRIAGISEPVRLYELINTAENAGQDEKQLVEIFHQAMDNYEKRLWKEASEGFKDALEIETRLAFNPDGGPSAIYLERCKRFETGQEDEEIRNEE